MLNRTLHWDEETLFTTGDEYFAALLQAIHNAQILIEFETYIFEKGILADRVVHALCVAARRGVVVRLIVDGWGSPTFVYDYWPQLKANGVRVRFFRATPWVLRRLPGDPKNIWRRIHRRFSQVNRGDHRKYCILDHHELWSGSFNVSDVHLSEVHGKLAWRDLGVRVKGQELKYARRAFKRAFRGWRAIDWPTRSPRLLLLNDTFMHKRRRRVELIRQLKSANSRIWLATPYFVPVGHVLRILLRQARHGLDVRLIVPKQSDVWIMKWMSWRLLKLLTQKGIQVFLSGPTFAHQKVFIADDWVCIGSTNLNHRSFLHDLELDVVLTHEQNKQRINQIFKRDQSLAQPFDTSSWAHLPLWKRALSSVFLLLKYWS